MANPSIEQPYDMVHVRAGKKPNGIGADSPALPLDALRKEIEAERAPFIAATRELQSSADRLVASIGDPAPHRKRTVQNRADVKTAAMIYDKLKEVLVDHGDGTWSYRDGWDDQTVAIALRCNGKSVGYRREKIFGPMPEAPAAPADKTAARALDLVLNLYKLLGQEVPPE